MKTLGHVQNRRDRCWLVAIRAKHLTPRQAAKAWRALAESLEAMGDMDVPKFNDLLTAFRRATVNARTINRPHDERVQ